MKISINMYTYNTQDAYIQDYLLQQRGPHEKPWQAGCGPRAVVWEVLLYTITSVSSALLKHNLSFLGTCFVMWLVAVSFTTTTNILTVVVIATN
jgi:hypothetical protein